MARYSKKSCCEWSPCAKRGACFGMLIGVLTFSWLGYTSHQHRNPCVETPDGLTGRLTEVRGYQTKVEIPTACGHATRYPHLRELTFVDPERCDRAYNAPDKTTQALQAKGACDLMTYEHGTDELGNPNYPDSRKGLMLEGKIRYKILPPRPEDWQWLFDKLKSSCDNPKVKDWLKDRTCSEFTWAADILENLADDAVKEWTAATGGYVNDDNLQVMTFQKVGANEHADVQFFWRDSHDDIQLARLAWNMGSMIDWQFIEMNTNTSTGGICGQLPAMLMMNKDSNVYQTTKRQCTNVLAHELGHALGIMTHTDENDNDPESIMHATFDPNQGYTGPIEGSLADEHWNPVLVTVGPSEKDAQRVVALNKPRNGNLGCATDADMVDPWSIQNYVQRLRDAGQSRNPEFREPEREPTEPCNPEAARGD